MRILIAEDDRVISLFLSLYLKNCSIKNETIITNDGKEALDKFVEIKNQGRENIDLIITDMSMPTMSGFDLIREIRKIDKYIPIIVITAYGHAFDTELEGCDVYELLTKPIHLGDLHDCLSEILENGVENDEC